MIKKIVLFIDLFKYNSVIECNARHRVYITHNATCVLLVLVCFNFFLSSNCALATNIKCNANKTC